MGNRAVITNTKKRIGIYLHWNGGPESVMGFMQACKELGYRNPNDDESYGFARICQAIGTFFGGECSLGVNTLDHLDTDNFDNGVYVIDKDWNISENYGKGSAKTLPTLQNLSDTDKEKCESIKNLTIKKVKISETITK